MIKITTMTRAKKRKFVAGMKLFMAAKQKSQAMRVRRTVLALVPVLLLSFQLMQQIALSIINNKLNI